NSASFGWTVSPVSQPAPTVTLTSTPVNFTTATSVTFAWTTTGSVTSTTCTLDGASAGCASPAAYSGLTVGSHTFTATVANDSGSNTASYGWTQAPKSPKPPTVTFTRTPAQGATRAKFAWTTTHIPTSTTCSVDGAPATPCTSPTIVNVTAGTTHTFVVTVSN